MSKCESYKFQIECESLDKLYEQINNAADGWYEVRNSEGTHFIKVDKITKWKAVSESELKAAQEEHSKQMADFIKNFNF